MPKTKSSVKFFKTCPGTKGEQIRQNIFEVLKNEKGFSIKNISTKAGASKGAAASLINKWVKKDMLKISGTKGEGLIGFNSGHCEILGIGFSGNEAILVAMNLAGKVVSKEHIAVEIPHKKKIKNKEIVQIVSEIKQRTKLAGNKFCRIGIALPDEMSSANPKAAEIITKSIRGIWRTDVYIAREATAAGYGERNLGKKDLSSDEILYMHSDIGTGAVVKKEAVFEVDEPSRKKDNAYLKPWDQFNIVDASRRLIEKGVGTDIVGMVGGDVGKITLAAVLKAANNKDELAEDLVKRSALAMGVRVAYLVNMFGVKNVVLGGGTERKEGSFLSYVQESANKFVLSKVVKKLKIVPGVLGEEAPSIGAAYLCRLGLFMEE